MDEIRNLSDLDLYNELLIRGAEIGPVVETTRELYENMLVRLLNSESMSPKMNGTDVYDSGNEQSFSNGHVHFKDVMESPNPPKRASPVKKIPAASHSDGQTAQNGATSGFVQTQFHGIPTVRSQPQKQFENEVHSSYGSRMVADDIQIRQRPTQLTDKEADQYRTAIQSSYKYSVPTPRPTIRSSTGSSQSTTEIYSPYVGTSRGIGVRPNTFTSAKQASISRYDQSKIIFALIVVGLAAFLFLRYWLSLPEQSQISNIQKDVNDALEL